MVETIVQTIEKIETPNKSVRVERYTSENRGEWNAFIENSKNGLFLFYRDYMEYHADRFTDCSLLFRDGDGKLIAVMPANLSGDALVSHSGLTFGGIVSGNRMKTPQMLEIFESLTAFARGERLKRIIYKAVPHIYHMQPSEEDLYALFRRDAKLFRRDISTTIYLKERLSLSKGRKWAAGQSRKNQIEVRESNDFETFMRLESELLAEKYNAVPVHTVAEIKLLASLFPSNIKLFGAFCQSEMLAGIIVYESKTVAHTQYIAANYKGKKLCALDGILQYLITLHYAEKRYFDFGISTEQQGNYLNTGLIDFKESWGGRAVAYDFYELDIK